MVTGRTGAPLLKSAIVINIGINILKAKPRLNQNKTRSKPGLKPFTKLTLMENDPKTKHRAKTRKNKRKLKL